MKKNPNSKLNFKKTPMKIPILLCEKHFKKKPKEFTVKISDKWSYIALPTTKGNASCHLCTNSLKEPSIFLREANLRGAN